MNTCRRILSWMLCLVLALTMLPADMRTAASADESPEPAEEQLLTETAEEEEEPEQAAPAASQAEEEPEKAEAKPVQEEKREEPEKKDAEKPAKTEEEKEKPEPTGSDAAEQPAAEKDDREEDEDRDAQDQQAPAATDQEEEQDSEAAVPDGQQGSGNEEQDVQGLPGKPETEPDSQIMPENEAGATEDEDRKEEPASPAEPEEAEHRDGQDPAPAAKDQPGEDPEDGAEDQNREEDGQDFRPGYVRLNAGTVLYQTSFRTSRLGTLSEEAVAYAVEQDEAQESLCLVFAAEGEPAAAWVRAEDAQPLTGEEQEAQEREPADLVWQENIRLKNAVILPEKTESREQEPAVPQETETPRAENEPDASGEQPEDGEFPEDDPDGDPAPQAKIALESPEGLEVTDAGADGTVVAWRFEPGEIYELRRRQDQGKWVKLSASNTAYQTDGGRMSFSDRQAVRGHVYQYALRAWDETLENRSRWVNCGLFHAKEPVLKAAVVKSTGYPKLTWSKSNGADGYVIYRNTINRETGKSTGFKKIKTVPADTRACLDQSVKINRRYEYRVLPFRKVGSKQFAGCESKTAAVNVRPIAGAPKNLKAAQTKDGVKLTWDAVKGSSSYIVYYTNNPYAANPKWKRAGATKKTTFTVKDKITAKKSGVYRRYRVFTAAKLNGKVERGPASVSQPVYRLAQTTIRLTKGGQEDTIEVSWKKVRGAHQYEIGVRQEGADSYSVITVDGSKTSVLLPENMVAGTKKHVVYVRPVSRPASNRTGKLQKGPASAKKSITPTWTYVVIVGNYDYPGTEEDLPGVKFDIAGMQTVYKKRGAARITAGANKTANEIKTLIAEGFSGAGENSICVLIYAGHGYEGSGKLYCNGDTSMSAAELKTLLDRYARSRHVVFIHQACSSGGVIGKGAMTEEEAEAAERKMVNAILAPFQTTAKNGEFANTKYTVIAAAKCWTSSWTVWEGTRNPYRITNGFSPMLRFLAASGGYDYYTRTTGLKGDADRNGRVSVREAFNYAKPRVKNFKWYGEKISSTMVGSFPEPDLPLF